MTGLKVKVIGNASNFWLWSERDGFDLTHPETSSSPPLHPRISLQTTNSPITIAPSKTALVIIDHALPAARKAGIQVIWLTWGLTDADLEVMSPTMLRIFKFDDNGSAQVVPAPGSESKQKEGWTDGGMGAELGEVVLTDGTRVDMGRMMMRDQWNTALHRPLRDHYEASLHSDLPDVWLRKNRVSGICDSSTDLTGFLAGKVAHIKTLLFAGVNVDQCVYGTMQDANLKSWDTDLLKDGCGTISPEFATQMSIHNCGKSWGFVTTCEQLGYGVQNMAGK
ncbi:isochorismatase family protein [Amylocarpus encephaloides]|uniref:Isochorismatase family protein n=1 Tax=Amylocarpus encephaloides TaxID=45428 RepID=A0A9P7YC07_9HELO|nr:isochorismatase family protein [Amylocarpus encephaloides]